MRYTRDEWDIGDVAWFEYHCYESPESSDAQVWYRSHQQVRVISGPTGEYFDLDMTLATRAEFGAPNVYRVQWTDGFEYDVFEDELLTDPAGFTRPDPRTEGGNHEGEVLTDLRNYYADGTVRKWTHRYNWKRGQ